MFEDQAVNTEDTPSMDDTLSKAFDDISGRDDEPGDNGEAEQQAGRARDEFGRFKGNEQPEDAVADADAAADSEQEVEADAGQRESIQPPSSWRANVREQFAALPAEVQEEVLRRESDFHKGIEQYRTDADYGRNLKSVFAPYQQDFALVDPIFEDDKISGDVFDAVNVAAGNYSLRSKKTVSIVVGTSLDIIPLCNGLSYVFVDTGSHGDGLPMQEAKLLEDRMAKGGIMAWHDYKNQFVEVEAAYNYLLSTGKFEEVQINWQEIFGYVAEHNLEEGNNSWHLYPELPHPPNFVGALKRK